MKIKIDIKKKYAFIIAGAIIVLAIVLGAVAYGTNNPSVFGHSAGEVEIDIGGDTYTLQEAITQNLIGGGGGGMSFGDRVTKNVDQVYQAESDGLLIGIATIPDNNIYAYIEGYADTNSNPITVRARAAVTSVSGQDYPTYSNTFTMPVKKDEYYKVVRKKGFGGSTQTADNKLIVDLYWIPVGGAGGEYIPGWPNAIKCDLTSNGFKFVVLYLDFESSTVFRYTDANAGWYANFDPDTKLLDTFSGTGVPSPNCVVGANVADLAVL